MYDAWQRGDQETARRLHFDLHPVVDLLFVETNPAPAKLVLAQEGLIASPHVRPPLVPVTRTGRERVAQLWAAGRAARAVAPAAESGLEGVLG